MSLLLLFKRVTRVFRPSTPVRGMSVLVSSEKVWAALGRTEAEVLKVATDVVVGTASNNLFVTSVERRDHVLIKPKISAGNT